MEKREWCGYPSVADGENNLRICLLISTEYTNMMDRWTPHDGLG